jgi:CheY-like chemotaxis protein
MPEPLLLPLMPGVLVVDDHEQVRQMLHTALRVLGFSVRTAASGREAVEEYRRGRDAIGIVLLDVQMPVMDGPQTLTTLQRIDPRVRCCFMSGGNGRYAVADLLALGAAAFIPKPFDLDVLARALRQAAGVAAM